MKICSACLLGINCRYDGGNNLDKCPERIVLEYTNHGLIPICPEQLGGLPTPRNGARIVQGDGYDVLEGRSKVLTDDGQDVTAQYIRGAYEVLRIAKALDISGSILKQGSPSCGSGFTQGGYSKRSVVKGDGVTAALLKKNGIEVYCE